jgi:excisionase family DNA binding protein
MNITFNEIPQAIEILLAKMEKIESFLCNKDCISNSDEWFSLDQLCKYHPGNPSRQTVYGWVCSRSIPFHKAGKKLLFLKSEIDNWIKSGRVKTFDEIQSESDNYIIRKSALSLS